MKGLQVHIIFQIREGDSDLIFSPELPEDCPENVVRFSLMLKNRFGDDLQAFMIARNEDQTIKNMGWIYVDKSTELIKYPYDITEEKFSQFVSVLAL